MKPYIVNLINGIVLVGLGLLGYFLSESPSMTAFIPVIIGALLLIITPAFRKGNKAIAHVAVLLTVIILIGLVMPLRGALSRGDNGALIRVIIMMTVSVWAFIVFIKSFIDARKSRV